MGFLEFRDSLILDFWNQYFGILVMVKLKTKEGAPCNLLKWIFNWVLDKLINICLLFCLLFNVFAVFSTFFHIRVSWFYCISEIEILFLFYYYYFLFYLFHVKNRYCKMNITGNLNWAIAFVRNQKWSLNFQFLC